MLIRSHCKILSVTMQNQCVSPWIQDIIQRKTWMRSIKTALQTNPTRIRRAGMVRTTEMTLTSSLSQQALLWVEVQMDGVSNHMLAFLTPIFNQQTGIYIYIRLVNVTSRSPPLTPLQIRSSSHTWCWDTQMFTGPGREACSRWYIDSDLFPVRLFSGTRERLFKLSSQVGFAIKALNKLVVTTYNSVNGPRVNLNKTELFV